MNDKNQIKFDKAIVILNDGRISDFCNSLIELYDDLTCSCFFRRQDHSIYAEQLEIVARVEDDPNDFDLNLVKGFVYLLNDMAKQSFNYLSRAIDLDMFIDLSWSLRASLDSEINPNCKVDALCAVLLNPTARNYFVLAGLSESQDDIQEDNKSLIYYSNAIKLRPDFACAYYNRGSIYEKLDINVKAIDDYKECIQIEKSHWAYFNLCHTLLKEKRHEEVRRYADLGAENDPINKDFYQYRLFFDKIKGGSYETALKYLNKLHDTHGEIESGHNDIEIDSIVNNIILLQANAHFQLNTFDQAIIEFEKVLRYDGSLSNEIIPLYFQSILKVKKPDILIDSENPIFKRLDSLKFSYRRKKGEGKVVLEEEENVNKLMQYQSDDAIDFGNYEAEVLSAIIKKDPHYVLWGIINLDHFSINNSLFLNGQIKAEPDYLFALEINLIKELIIEAWWYPDEKEKNDEPDGYYDDEYDGPDFCDDYMS
jgi:tetratricopeptide (TPR) repeat protein